MTITAAATNISTDDVIGIDAPAFGKTPDKTAVVSAEAQYTVAAVSWEPACDSFLGNTVYTVLVSLETKDNFRFAASPTVSINGQTAKFVSGAGSEEPKISYAFPKPPASYDFISNTYSTTDVTASLNEYVAVSVYTDLPDMAKNTKYQWYRSAGNIAGTGTAIYGRRRQAMRSPQTPRERLTTIASLPPVLTVRLSPLSPPTPRRSR